MKTRDTYRAEAVEYLTAIGWYSATATGVDAETQNSLVESRATQMIYHAMRERANEETDK